jgi:hypothetical protein
VRFGSSAKKEICSIWIFFSMQSFKIFGALELPFSYFTRLDQFEYWRNIEILKKGLYRLLDPTHCHGPSPSLICSGLRPHRLRLARPTQSVSTDARAPETDRAGTAFPKPCVVPIFLTSRRPLSPRPCAPSTALLFLYETIIEAKSPFAFSSSPSRRSSFSIAPPPPLPCPPSAATSHRLSGTTDTLMHHLLLEQALPQPWAAGLKTIPKPPAAFDFVCRRVPPHGWAAPTVPQTNRHHRELPTVAPQLPSHWDDPNNL